MVTVQIVFDQPLLAAADRAAREEKKNRSALVREALSEYLRRREIRRLEEQEREAYRRIPDNPKEWEVWEKEAVWPDD